jgi:hypothetical protein
MYSCVVEVATVAVVTRGVVTAHSLRSGQRDGTLAGGLGGPQGGHRAKRRGQGHTKKVGR